MRGVGGRRNVCCIGLRPLVEGGVGSVCAYSCLVLRLWNAEHVAEGSCLHEFDGFARLAAGLKGCLPFPGVRETGGTLLNRGFPFRFIADVTASLHLVNVDFAKRENLCTERSGGRVSCRAFFERRGSCLFAVAAARMSGRRRVAILVRLDDQAQRLPAPRTGDAGGSGGS